VVLVEQSAEDLSAPDGCNVEEADLELYGVSERCVRRLSAAGPVTFSQGLPAHAWLWLKRGASWIDYRSIDARSVWTGDLNRAGVEIEPPIEPQAHIEALIPSGEGPQTEFKEMLPTTKERRTLKSVAAFATGDGGTIIFGVNRDEVTVTGIAEGNTTKQRDELANLIRATVVPMPQVQAQDYRIDGQVVLVLEVEPGQSPPYGLVTPNTRDKPEFFVRRGASTYPAQPGELREATLSRSGPTDSAIQPGPFYR
jgi:hypothetical protein